MSIFDTPIDFVKVRWKQKRIEEMEAHYSPTDVHRLDDLREAPSNCEAVNLDKPVFQLRPNEATLLIYRGEL